MNPADSPAATTHGTPSGKRDYRFPVLCAFLALVTLLLYWPVVRHDFINFDDFSYITENPFVQQGVTLDAVGWAFTTGYASNWHPLTWISHMLDCQIYGVNHPGGHHLTNLLFHVLNTLLMFALWRRLTGAVWRSALVAALFAWHPLHVESVAWVAERKDVLSTFFFLLTLLAYARYAEDSRNEDSKSKTWYWVTLAWFALGLMSKPMVVTLPFVLLLLDFWPLRRISASIFQTRPEPETELPPSPSEGRVRRRASGQLSFQKLLPEKIPFFLLSAASCVVTFLVQKHGGAVDVYTTFSQRVENMFLGYVGYLQKMAWPSGLAVLYPLPESVAILKVLGAAGLLVVITAVAVGFVKSRPWILFGWLWFLGMLVPVIGLVQVGSQSMADRYSYLPLTGWFVIFAWGLAETLEHFPGCKKTLAGVIVAPLLIACLAVTRRQLPYWQNSETLFRHELAVATNNVTGHINLGRALDDAGRPGEAKAEFIAALKGPALPNTLVSVGAHFAREGDDTNAIKLYQQAMQARPFYADAHYDLGNVFAHEGKLEDAIKEYTEALHIKPDMADAHNNLGAVFLRMGRLNEAQAEFNTALRLQTKYPEAEDQLGHVLLKLGHPEQALPHFRTAAALSPKLADAHLQLGLALARQGSLQEALGPLQAAVKLEPKNVEAVFNLAALYDALQQFDLAADSFAQVTRLNPDDPAAVTRMAAALAKQGKFPAALAAYKWALGLNYNSVNALQGMAWILATCPNAELRDGAEAVRLAQHAAELTGRKQPLILTVLDAALAENGKFDEAIKTAQETAALSRKLNQNDLAEQALARIELYKSGKPFHE